MSKYAAADARTVVLRDKLAAVDRAKRNMAAAKAAHANARSVANAKRKNAADQLGKIRRAKLLFNQCLPSLF